MYYFLTEIYLSALLCLLLGVGVFLFNIQQSIFKWISHLKFDPTMVLFFSITLLLSSADFSDLWSFCFTLAFGLLIVFTLHYYAKHVFSNMLLLLFICQLPPSGSNDVEKTTSSGSNDVEKTTSSGSHDETYKKNSPHKKKSKGKRYKPDQKKLEVAQFNSRNTEALELARLQKVPLSVQEPNPLLDFFVSFWECDGTAPWDFKKNIVNSIIITQNDFEILHYFKNLGLPKADNPLGDVVFQNKRFHRENLNNYQEKINEQAWIWRIYRTENPKHLWRMALIINHRLSSPKKLKQYHAWFLHNYAIPEFRKHVPKNFWLQTNPREVSLERATLAGLFAADGSFSISMNDAGKVYVTMSLAAQEDLGLLLNCRNSLKIGHFDNPSAARDGLWSKSQKWRVKDKESLQLLIGYFDKFLIAKKIINFKKFVFVLNLIWNKHDIKVILSLIPFINNQDFIIIKDLSDGCYKAVKAFPLYLPEQDVILFGDPETGQAFVFEPRTQDLPEINWITKEGGHFGKYQPEELNRIFSRQFLPWYKRLLDYIPLLFKKSKK